MANIIRLIESNRMKLECNKKEKEVLERSKQSLLWINENLIETLDCGFFLVYRNTSSMLIVREVSAGSNSFIMYLSIDNLIISDIWICDHSSLEECKQILLEKANFLYDVVKILDTQAGISFEYVENRLKVYEFGSLYVEDIFEAYSLSIDVRFNLTVKINPHSQKMKAKAEKLKELYPSTSINYASAVYALVSHERSRMYSLKKDIESIKHR